MTTTTAGWRRGRASTLAATLALIGGLVAMSDPAASAASGGQGVSAQKGHGGLLGLPPLSAASRYGYAPATRTVSPRSVVTYTAQQSDFVTAGSMTPSVTVSGKSPTNSGPSASEAAHDFLSGPHATRVRLMGAAVEEAGPNVARAWFSVVLHAPAHGSVRVRVEDAASASADYRVLVDGTDVYHRGPLSSQAGLVSESGPQFKGLLHYSFDVPQAVLARAPLSRSGRLLTVEFRNGLSPGPGARIARVWAYSASPRKSSSSVSQGSGNPYAGSVAAPSSAISGRGMTMQASTYARPYAIFDFGRDVGGQVSFDVSGLAKPVTLGLAFAESYEYMTSVSDQACGTSGLCTETHYLTIHPGQTTVTDPSLRGGFRYLMVFLDSPGALRISRLHVDFTPNPGVSNPASYSGAFLSSSGLLNSIWYAGAYTAEMDTIDPTTGRPFPPTPGPLVNNATIASGPTAVVDGAKRDRLDWGGDQSVEDSTLLLSNPGSHASSDPTVPTGGGALAAQDSFAFLASHAFSNGEIPGVYLTKTLGFQQSWGVYSLLEVLNYYEIYLYTGDRAFLDRFWPAIQADLAWARGLVGSDGLVSMPAQFSGSWGYGASGQLTYINSVYILALKDMTKIASLEGDASVATAYSSEASSVAAAVNSHLWDASAGAYEVSTTDAAIPQDGNAMALVAGVATGQRASSVISHLNGPMATKYGTETINQSGNIVGQYVSPFITYDQLLGELGQNTRTTTDVALAQLERLWGYMLTSPLGTSSTFWEGVSLHGNPEMGSYTSLAHGWASGPVSLLTNQILGVTPTAGGLSGFSVLPHPPSSLPWAEGRVPGPSGTVTAAWRQSGGGRHFGLEVQAPSTDTYTAGVPVSSHGESVWANGNLVWSGTQAKTSAVRETNGYVEISGLSGTTTLLEQACTSSGCPTKAPNEDYGHASVPRRPATALPRPSSDPSSSPAGKASQGPDASASAYNLSPSSRSLPPVRIYKVLPRGGSVTNASNLVRPDGRPTVLSLRSGNQASSPLVVLDMGKDVGGRVSVKVSSVSSPAPTLQTCFSESTAYMALQPGQNNGESNYAPGCDTANFPNGYPGVPYTWNSDGHLIPVDASKLSGHGPATFTDSQIRGGFRYLTLYLSSPGSISIDSVRVQDTAAPNQSNLSKYQGSFASSSRILDHLWYSGAYTVQLDTAAANTLKSWPYTTGEPDQASSQMPHTTSTESVILDGAKRDRDVWEGDLAVEGPVTALSTGNLAAWRNSLQALGAQQLPNGYVPAEGLVGPHNFGEEFNYGTYVLWFVNNLYQYWLYTGDSSFLSSELPRAVAAEAYVAKQVDSTGLLTFANTGPRGTGPAADPGNGACGTFAYYLCGHLTYVNSLYYLTLREMAKLASSAGHPTEAASYAAEASSLKATINTKLWNRVAGAYELSPSRSSVFPQDAQAMAVFSGVASPAQAAAALSYLRQNTWEAFGSELVSPTGSAGGMPAGYQPFSSGYELLARYAASTSAIGDSMATQLMVRGWGHMLNAAYGPQSTFWEKLNQQGLPGIGQFTSLAHGWASMPTVALTTDVLGVAPTAGGFSDYVVQPHPGSLSWARGTVPTPKGSLALSWRRSSEGSFQMSLEAPRGTSGSVSVPTFGRSVVVRMDNKVVWNGASGKDGATLSGGYVVVPGVDAGHHHFTSNPISAQTTQLLVTVNPGHATAAAGGSGVLRVSVYADGPGTLKGTLTARGPAGWTIGPGPQPFSIRSDGSPSHKKLYVYYLHIPSSSLASNSIVVTATTTSGASSAATATVGVPRTLFDFAQGSTDGWQAGQNVVPSSLSSVTSIANGPGTCQPDPSCLQAFTAYVSAEAPRVIYRNFSPALDLATATQLYLHFNSYGGRPVVPLTGHTATVILVSGSHQFVTTVSVAANTWTKIVVPLSSWPYRNDITAMSVAMAGTGTTHPWNPAFQIDDVGYAAGPG